MADKTVQDWMAATLIEGQAHERQEIIRDMAGSIDLGVLTIPKVISDMGPFLGPGEDLTVVARALQLLPAILKTMQTQPISRQDVHALIEYLCARLQNRDYVPSYHAGLKEVANSLSILAGWRKFPPGDAAVVAQSVFGLCQGQGNIFISQKPDTRLAFYTLISLLFEKFKQPLERDLGLPLLVTGIADLAELEKNPSCLKVLFLLYAHISKNWALQPAESNKVWELFVRYFPITLGGTATDPNKPSPEELKSLLLECFTSSDKYADDAFTLLLSNIDTDQAANKKQEIMSTIYECAISYSNTTLLQHAPEIWSAIKYEIWNGESEDFIEESLHILRGLFYSLRTQPWESDENILATLVSDISNEIFDKMSDNRQFLRPSGRILRAISSSSSHIFFLVTKAILPKLDVLAQSVELPLEKKSLLSVFNNILQARLDLEEPALELSTKGDDKPDVAIIDAFLKFRQSIIDIYFGVMSKVEDGTGSVFGTAAIEGLVLLTKIPEFLSPAEKAMVLEKIDGVMLSSSREQEIHVAALRAIEDMSSRDPTIFKDTTLPKLIKRFPESLSTNQETSQVTEIVDLLQDLILVSCSSVTGLNEVPTAGFRQRNFDACMENLLQLWHNVVGQNGRLEYSNAILAAIFRGMELFDYAVSHSNKGLGSDASNLGVGRYSHIVLPLLARLVKLEKHTNLPSTPGDLHYIGLANPYDIDQITLQLVGKITTLAVRSESAHLTGEDNFLLLWNQQHEPSAIWSLFCPAAEGLILPQAELRSGPEEKCSVNVLSVSLLAGIKPKDKAKLKIRVGDTALAMLLNALSTENNASMLARTSMLWFLQLLVNKFGALEEPLENESRTLVEVMVDLVEGSSSKSEEEVDSIYRTLAYFTAATVAAHKPQSSILLDLMIKGISNTRNGRKVAQSFRVLLAPAELMNEQNFCFVRRLRKQRVFTIAVTPLVELWRASETKEAKEKALLALAGLLAYMEPTTLKDSVESLLPLVLEGTNVQNDDWAKHAFIQTILTLLPLCPEVMESHLDSLIKRMTDRTHNTLDSPSDSSVRCRAAALDVLALLVQHISPAVLTRRKSKLMFELDVALSDCSSTVRSRADKCKMAWFNLED